MFGKLKAYLFGTLPNDDTKFYNGKGDFSVPVGSGPSVGVQSSFLVEGGVVIWLQDYDFIVSAATYFILGTQYTSPESSITLDAADATDPRIDLIVVNNAGTVTKVTGDAAPNPSEPDIDPATQLKLGLILVPALSTEPAGVSNEVVYADAAGGPGEWNWTASGASIDVDSTNNPKAPSTKDIEGTTVVSGVYAQGEKPTGVFTPSTAELLILYIRSKAQWANGRSLIVSLRLNGVLVGSNVTISRSGTFGFNSATLGTYQVVAIPITTFAIPAGGTVNQIRITASGAGFGFYIDDIFFQIDGATQGGGSGLTQEQADARYLKQLSNLSDLSSATAATAQLNEFTADTGAGGLKGLVKAPASGDASKFLKGNATWADPPGLGDVVGPGTAEDDNIVLFDSTSGKLIKDSGQTIAELILAVGAGDVIGPATNEDNNIAVFDGVDSKTIKDGLSTIAEVIAAGAAAAPQGDVVGPSSATDGNLAVFDLATGKLIKDGGAPITKTRQITLVIDGGGSAITTGVKGFISVPFACTIKKWRLLSIDAAATAGAIKIDVWKDTYANFPPTDADSITDAHEPEIAASGNKAEDNDLADWADVTIDAGDVLGFNVDSVATVTKIMLALEIE